MAIIRVPTDVAISPENGEEIRYDTDTRRLFDQTGDSCELDDLFGTRHWTTAVKWAKENYPED